MGQAAAGGSQPGEASEGLWGRRGGSARQASSPGSPCGAAQRGSEQGAHAGLRKGPGAGMWGVYAPPLQWAREHPAANPGQALVLMPWERCLLSHPRLWGWAWRWSWGTVPRQLLVPLFLCGRRPDPGGQRGASCVLLPRRPSVQTQQASWQGRRCCGAPCWELCVGLWTALWPGLGCPGLGWGCQGHVMVPGALVPLTS